ncbi:MAG: ABC transporter permease [Treponema sp.]|uniref:ABC transporter permease n=1 Tax=Treponema sp. TaxID=166 RepID=UPI0025E75090|nr:ABC transporter permease [Treponema sp.]MBQ9282305.1 ABC transporter permease [Treponema sp.]
MILAFALFLQVAVQTGTHILYGILGGILFERAGQTNLGTEGMMLLGAAFGYFVGSASGSPLFAVLCAGLAGSAGALIYAFITITLRGNQIVTGLVLTTFGTGVASFMGKYLAASHLSVNFKQAFSVRAIPLLSKIPVLGPMLFEQSIYVYISLILAFFLWAYYRYTRWGLNIRAIGENPAAADASGINVTLYKYIHVLAGGFLCGLGGAYLSLAFVGQWQENITAGAGWISVAFVIFCTWSPLKAILCAWAFGALSSLALKCQSVPIFGHIIPGQLLDMIPYIATIVVLVLMGLHFKKENQGPAALGASFFREER